MSTTANALIEVQQHPTLGPAVSGRAVYAITSVSNASRDIFADWFRGNQRKLNLIEKVDFETTSVVLPGSPRKCIEHILTIDAARRIAEVALKKRGVELAAYLKYYTTLADSKSTGDGISLFGAFTGPTSIAEATTRPMEPQPEQPIATTPLSPAQQLLVEVQKLVDAEQRRSDEPEVPSEQLKGLDARLNQLERKVNTILYFFQQSATALRSLAPTQLPYDAGLVSTPLPDLDPPKRAKINRLVDGYAAAKTVTHQEVWKHLYGHLSSRFGFDAWQYAQNKKNPNYLEVVEENGQLDNLYSLAVELLTPSQR